MDQQIPDPEIVEPSEEQEPEAEQAPELPALFSSTILPDADEAAAAPLPAAAAGEEELFSAVSRPVPPWLATLRAALGMRAASPTVRHVYRTPTDPSAAREEVRRARRAVPYFIGILAFGLLCGGFVWVYGRVAGPTRTARSVIAGETTQQAMARLSAGDKAGARQLIEQARANFSGDSAVDFLDGYLSEAESAAPDDSVRGLVRTAGRQAGLGDRAAAAEALGQALERDPKLVSVRILRAALYIDMGRSTEALADADAIEKVTGPSSAVAGIRGMASLQLGKLDTAVVEFRHGLTLAPGSTGLRLRYADALNRMGRAGEALVEARQVLSQDPRPSNPDAQLAVGIASEVLQDEAGAETAYRAAVEASPDHVKALNNLAYLLATVGRRPDEAAPFAERAVKLAPRAPEVMDTLAVVWLAQKRPAEAERLLREALPLGDVPELADHLVEALRAQGKTAEATAELRALAGDKRPQIAARAKELLRTRDAAPR